MTTMDGTFLRDVRWLAVKNFSGEDIPAFAALVVHVDHVQESAAEVSVNNRGIIWPVGRPFMEEDGYDTMVLINGPMVIPKDGFGYASMDYPLPLLVDLSTWAEGGDDMPVLGLVNDSNDADLIAWPAVADPGVPLWYGIDWHVDADGNKVDDVVWVVPTTAVNDIVKVGDVDQGFSYSLSGGQEQQFMKPFTCKVSGTYLFGFATGMISSDPTATIHFRFYNNDGIFVETLASSGAMKVDTVTEDVGYEDHDVITLKWDASKNPAIPVAMTYPVYLQKDDVVTMKLESNVPTFLSLTGPYFWWTKLTSAYFPNIGNSSDDS